MKPRLKLLLDGQLCLLIKSPVPVPRFEALRLVRIHYGSRLAFATQWGLNYEAVCGALHTSDPYRRGGEVAQIRAILGLRSEPSDASRKLCQWHAVRKAAREPDAVFGITGAHA